MEALHHTHTQHTHTHTTCIHKGGLLIESVIYCLKVSVDQESQWDLLSFSWDAILHSRVKVSSRSLVSPEGCVMVRFDPTSLTGGWQDSSGALHSGPHRLWTGGYLWWLVTWATHRADQDMSSPFPQSKWARGGEQERSHSLFII
jgi:hypothetical protein